MIYLPLIQTLKCSFIILCSYNLPLFKNKYYILLKQISRPHKLFLKVGILVTNMLASSITRTLEIPTFVLLTQWMLFLLQGQNTQGKALQRNPVLQNDTCQREPINFAQSSSRMLPQNSKSSNEKCGFLWTILVEKNILVIIIVGFCGMLLLEMAVTLSILCSLECAILYRGAWVLGKQLLVNRGEAMSEDIHLRPKLLCAFLH